LQESSKTREGKIGKGGIAYRVLELKNQILMAEII